MSIIKIKNLKYSPSKNQEEIKWAEVEARRKRMLAESDWTQLPDVKLTEYCKNRWGNWREQLRQLRRTDFLSAEEFSSELKNLEYDRASLYTDYSTASSIKDVVSGKKFLHKLLMSCHNNEDMSMFPPNLEEKYQEALDLLALALVKNNASASTMDELINFVSDNPDIEYNLTPFPFLELTMSVKNFMIPHETLLYILREKKRQYNFSLQSEHMLIHYENRIDACTTVADVLLAKQEIEMHYGY